MASCTAELAQQGGLGCPVCGSERGAAVRAGILDERAGDHLLATLAPFAALAALVLALALWPRRPRRRQ